MTSPLYEPLSAQDASFLFFEHRATHMMHGFFHTYEAFAHVIDSMFNQHVKWLDICKNHVPWRASVASQNILLSSTVWRQDLRCPEARRVLALVQRDPR